ncbi:MAG: ABC transporter permease [Actinomycetales bacterium]|nr:MAG: ABC transporter permease [Actinomycetales bacterium]
MTSPERWAGSANRNAAYGLLGVGLFFLIWQILALIFHRTIIASPVDTFLALIQMVQTVEFWQTLGITLSRFGLGLLLGCLIGVGLGLFAGVKPNVRLTLEPMRWALMGVPPVVVVTISMIWFGIGGVQTIFVAAILILPIMYVNTIEGIEAVDPRILEMGRVYKAPGRLLLREIYLPGIGGPALAGLTLAAGLGIRIVVLAEVLGSFSGIGYEFSLARINLETPKLFAWVIVCLLLVGFFEWAILGPAKERIMGWRKEQQSHG